MTVSERTHGSGAPASAAITPSTAAPSSVCTIPRRSRSSATAAAARIANCQASFRAAASSDRGAEDRSDRGGAGTVEERAGVLVATQSLEPSAAEQDEGERGSERDEGGEHAAGEAVGGVADRGDRRDDRSGGDLPSATALRNCALLIQW